MIGLFDQAVGPGDTKGAESIREAMLAEMQRRAVRPSARSKL